MPKNCLCLLPSSHHLSKPLWLEWLTVMWFQELLQVEDKLHWVQSPPSLLAHNAKGKAFFPHLLQLPWCHHSQNISEPEIQISDEASQKKKEIVRSIWIVSSKWQPFKIIPIHVKIQILWKIYHKPCSMYEKKRAIPGVFDLETLPKPHKFSRTLGQALFSVQPILQGGYCSKK